jgi:hypothetical protein
MEISTLLSVQERMERIYGPGEIQGMSFIKPENLVNIVQSIRQSKRTIPGEAQGPGLGGVAG